ncbi:hypothetical protein LUZ60_006252 [Juncus effusus]|nr:hypothetical protein LUZ60_006252 [Juncus effusus]
MHPSRERNRKKRDRSRAMDQERLRDANYRECMKNHAAKLGTYATDGCCEYTPDERNPASLTCGACGCHRNFHRKVILDQISSPSGSPTGQASGPNTGPGDQAGKRRSRTKFTEDQKTRMRAFAESIGWRIPKREGGGYVVRGEDDDVARFCREIGVSRQVFKVWMHNHKNNAPNASSTTHTAETSPADLAGSAGGGGDNEIRANYDSI